MRRRPRSKSISGPPRATATTGLATPWRATTCRPVATSTTGTATPCAPTTSSTKQRWQVGQPLPRDVVYYTVPQPVLVRLPPQPQGYRYVHVNGDVLLIAIGTLMVIDGMDGLLRM